MSLTAKPSVFETEWKQSERFRHVWQHLPSGKWTYEDETNCFCEEHMVDTEEQARQELNDYCAFSLNGSISELEKALENNKALSQLESVQKALKQIAECKGRGALCILRDDIENIRSHHPVIAEWIENKPKNINAAP